MCESREHDGYFVECSLAAACASESSSQVDTTRSIINWLVTFNLYCEPASTYQFMQYLFFVGFFIGIVFMAPLSDYFGRKAMILISSIILSLAYLKLVFSKELVTWAAVLLFSGSCAGLFYSVCVIYLSEIATQQSAVLYICAFHLSFPASGIIVALILLYSPDWKTPATILAIVPLVIISYFAYIVESPRFLAAKGSFDDARLAIIKVASSNIGKVKRWTFDTEYMTYTRTYTEFEANRQAKWYQTKYILSNSSGRYYLFAFCTLLFCCGFAFSGLALSKPGIFKNILTDSIINYGIEFIVITISAFLYNHFGHIRPIFILLFLTSVVGISCTFSLWFASFAQGILTGLAKALILSAGLGAIAFSVSSCPVRVRGAGVGLTFGVGIIGLIIGHIVNEHFKDRYHYLFAVSALVGIIGLRFTCEPGDYRTNDDIYEIAEDAKKNFSGYRMQSIDDSVRNPNFQESPVKTNAENFSIKDLLKEEDMNQGENENKSSFVKDECSMDLNKYRIVNESPCNKNSQV